MINNTMFDALKEVTGGAGAYYDAGKLHVIDIDGASREATTEEVTAAEAVIPVLAATKQQEAELRATDADMARITEDMYDYLTTSDPAFAAAMPQSVKDKMVNRKALRNQ